MPPDPASEPATDTVSGSRSGLRAARLRFAVGSPVRWGRARRLRRCARCDREGEDVVTTSRPHDLVAGQVPPLPVDAGDSGAGRPRRRGPRPGGRVRSRSTGPDAPAPPVGTVSCLSSLRSAAGDGIGLDVDAASAGRGRLERHSRNAQRQQHRRRSGEQSPSHGSPPPPKSRRNSSARGGARRVSACCLAAGEHPDGGVGWNREAGVGGHLDWPPTSGLPLERRSLCWTSGPWPAALAREDDRLAGS